jgi:hypothetical protein
VYFECAMCSGFGVLLSVQCVLGLVFFECAMCSRLVFFECAMCSGSGVL